MAQNYAHVHNVGGRGPAHVKFNRTQTTGRPVNSALCVVLALELNPAYFLAFLWPPTVAGPFE